MPACVPSSCLAALLLALGGLTACAEPVPSSDGGTPQGPSRAPLAIDAEGPDDGGASVYSRKVPARGGTGKVYMGREISHVMGHLGADWLERAARQGEERTDLLIDRLPLAADDVVADIGAGTGYFTFPVAGRVPEGRVYAVDIQPEMLARIDARVRERGFDNVTTVRGTVTDPNLPAGAVDLIFIVDAYHEFSHPREMGEALAAALRPGGRLILIEYRMEDPSVPIKRLHKMSEAQAKKEMAAIGLTWEETGDFLPRQHFLVFRKPGEQTP